MSAEGSLAARRRALVARSARERVALGAEIRTLVDEAGEARRNAIESSQRYLLPLVVAGTLFALAAGRRRSLALLGSGLALAGSIGRWRRIAAVIAGLLSDPGTRR